MEFRISVEGQEDGVAVTDLYNWVKQDPELRHAARLSLVHAEPGPGEMGADADTILAVANGVSAGVSALSAFAQVVLTWWSTRRSTAAVVARTESTVFRIDAAAKRAELSGYTADELKELLPALEPILRPEGFAIEAGQER